MSLYRDTEEMNELWNKIQPYIINGALADDTPDEIRELSEKYKRLAKEQEEFALSL